MTTESAILRAYALLSQSKYEEAEQMLRSVEGVLNTPSGADLFARLRFEQGAEEEARMIWDQVHRAFPDFEPAAKALEAFANPPPSDEGKDDAVATDGALTKRLKIAAAAAVVIGLLVSVLSAVKGCRNEPTPIRADSPIVTNFVERVETQLVDRFVTNYVDRVRTEVVDRVITNEVEKIIEVPSTVILTNYVEHIVEVPQIVTNTVTVTNVLVQTPKQLDVIDRGHGLDSTSVDNGVTGEDAGDQVAESSDNRDGSSGEVERKPMVLFTPYVVKPGETVWGLSQRFKFRIPDFRVYNQDIDNLDRVREGQTVNIPFEQSRATEP